jgi:DNA ligase (NAD+)
MNENVTVSEKLLAEVKHRAPMPRPQEGFSEEELLAFVQRVRERLQETGLLQFTVEPKLQGMSVELAYEEGVLSVAAAGSEYEEKIVTANIKTILTVPLTLWRIGDAPPFPEYLEVHSDVYIETKDFEKLNHDRKEKRVPLFRDVREAVQKSVGQVNARITARTPLNMFCHGVGTVQGSLPLTSYETMVVLQSWGFRVNRPHIRVCDTPDELIAACRAIREKSNQWPFVTEGALVQVNRMDLHEKLGNFPGWSLVYRF